MSELPLDYWNKLASQLITISSLLAGFSIAIMANLLVQDANKKLENAILKLSTIASSCFLIAVFAMTKILMATTEGYPLKVVSQDLIFPRTIGILVFFLGMVALTVVIALSGWSKSRKTGIFTTTVGILTFLMILMMLFEVKT